MASGSNAGPRLTMSDQPRPLRRHGGGREPGHPRQNLPTTGKPTPSAEIAGTTDVPDPSASSSNTSRRIPVSAPPRQRGTDGHRQDVVDLVPGEARPLGRRRARAPVVDLALRHAGQRPQGHRRRGRRRPQADDGPARHLLAAHRVVHRGLHGRRRSGFRRNLPQLDPGKDLQGQGLDLRPIGHVGRGFEVLPQGTHGRVQIVGPLRGARQVVQRRGVGKDRLRA